ncbi:MAG: translocation/assembly module TamB domain-containing protein [Bacteroidia bacterium]
MNKAGKITRFIWRTLKYSFLVVFLLLIVLVIAIQTSSVQTFLGQQASSWLSKELKTKISIGKIDIEFIKTAVLKEVYIEDLHKDTLLYAGTIRCDLGNFSYNQKKLTIKELSLQNIDAYLIKYKGDSTFNYQFISDYFSPKDTVRDTAAAFKIIYGDLVLKNVNFRYKDENDTAVTKGMNFADLDLKSVSGKISDIDIVKDTIRVNIQNLSAKEKCGLDLQQLNTLATISPLGVKMDSLLLRTDRTYLHGSYYMLTDSYESYNDFLEKVYLRANLRDSTHINAADIAYFVPDLLGMDEVVYLAGKIRGSVSSLHGDNIVLKYRKNTSFEGDFSIEGLPKMEDTYLHFEFDNLSTTRTDLVQVSVPPFDKKKKLSLPENIGKLGLIRYKGKLDGFINDMAAYGTLRTAIGTVSTDIGLSQEKGKPLAYHGKVRTENFRLGELLGNPEIGALTLDAKVKGKGVDLETLEANLEGHIASVVIRGYAYKNIVLTGDFKNKLFNGKFESRDENADLDFYGSASFVNKIPDLDFIATVNKMDFSKLNFFKQDSTSDFSSQISINLKGDNLDNLTGRINFDNTIYKTAGKEYKLSTFDLILEQNTPVKTIKLNSGIADIKMNGHFDLSRLGNSVNQYLYNYFPTFIQQNKDIAARYYDNFEFKIKIKKFNNINGLVLPDLQISPNTTIEGSFDAANNKMNLLMNSEQINYKSQGVKNFKVDVTTLENGINITTTADRVNLADSTSFGNFRLTTLAYDNRSEFTLDWDNQSKQRSSGEVGGKLVFSKSSFEMELQKFGVYVNDSLWVMKGDNRFKMDSSGVFNFHEFIFTNNSQSIKIEGLVSKNPKDQLTVMFDNFKLNQLNPVLKTVNLELEGSVSGTSIVSDLYHKVIFSSTLEFTKLLINKKSIGTGEINSFFDKSKDVVSLNGHFKKDYGVSGEVNFNNLQFAGYYYPNRKENNIDLDCQLQAIDLSIIQPYLKGILTLKRGYVNGSLKVAGSVNKPLLNGKLALVSVQNVRVDYLNTYYSVNGDITIEPDRIGLDGVYLYDMNGNSAVVWGNIFHDNFKNIKLDFDINATKFMCLNTNYIINPSYYGKAFITGNVGLYGTPEFMNMDINVKTEKGTQFNIPLSGPAEVGENDFIRFVKADSAGKNSGNDKNDLSGMNLNFNLEATPDAEIQLIFDEKAGDVIKAKGRGNINMNINTKGNFEMFGLYTITDGSYLFTLENFINKKFDVENGSTIKWSGDPYNADINITADYKQRASLAPFFPSVSSTAGSSTTASATTTSGGDNNKRYPVECKLFMRGKLLSPDITFGIGLPTVNDAIRQQVLGFINNEQELNRQVFSLLLLKSFVTPLALSNQSGVSAGSAVGSNATEMLSNQLSNWLSQLATNIDVGVNYRPGSALSNEELDLALSTQLFNDKLSIDGNVGVNNNTQTKASSMIGDLNVDYKLSEDGKTRVKVFNRSNDTYQITTSGGQFTQGVGVFFREEFDTRGELYRRYLAKLKKKKLPPKKEPGENDDKVNVNEP